MDRTSAYLTTPFGTMSPTVKGVWATSPAPTGIPLATSSCTCWSYPSQRTITCAVNQRVLEAALGACAVTLVTRLTTSSPVLGRRPTSASPKMTADIANVPPHPCRNAPALISFASRSSFIRKQICTRTTLMAVRRHLEGQEGVTGVLPRARKLAIMVAVIWIT